MADVARPRPLEFYNPRPLILAMCFFWGAVMGFCLFYFSPPKEFAGKKTKLRPDPQPAPAPGARNVSPPEITHIADTLPEAVRSNKVSIENFEVYPPQANLTTEGGLTGKTAAPLKPQTPRPAAPHNRSPTAPMAPPIPELMP